MEAKTVHAMTSYTYEEVKRAYDSAYGNIIEVHLIQGVLRKYIEWGLINEVMVPDIPEPEDGVDYYLDELLTHTVAIGVTVGGMKERDSDEEICSRAINGLRDGSLDGDSTIAWSKRVRDVEFDFETDLPFDRAAWNKAKLLELGLNEKGNPLRPGEKARPECETKLADHFPKQSMIARIMDRISEWKRRCRQAFTEAF